MSGNLNKFQLVSDLHMDMPKNGIYLQQGIIKPIADNLIVAGDLANGFARTQWFLDYASENWERTIICLGNHDHYGNHVIQPGKHISEKLRHNVHLENRSFFTIDEILIICTTMWSFVEPAMVPIVQNGMNDFRLIPFQDRTFKVNDMNEIHIVETNFLFEMLECITKPALVITHHLPDYSVISDQWIGDLLNDGFSAKLGNRILQYEDKILAWVHGHSHDTKITTIGKVPVIRNPLGLVGTDPNGWRFENPNFNPMFNLGDEVNKIKG